MQGITKSTLTAEVERKLDDLFQEEEIESEKNEEHPAEVEMKDDQDSLPFEQGADEQESPLAPLKPIVLPLDWEITDEAMDDFLKQTESFRSKCGEDEVLKTFIQILQALGKYIKKHKADSHPDAVRLLGSSFETFEKAFEAAELSEEERKGLLDQRIREFMELKQAIAKRRRNLTGEAKKSGIDMETLKAALKEVMQEFIGEIMRQVKEALDQFKVELAAAHKENWHTD